MIDENLQLRVHNFTNWWEGYCRAEPALSLDSTWPTLGILDCLTFTLRKKEDYNENEANVLRCAAAYIGVVADSCWSAFEGVKVRVYETEEGVFIRATGGKFLGDSDFFEVNLLKSLIAAMNTLPEPLAVVGSYMRDYLPADYNAVSLFGIGVMLGQCPWGKGKWNLCSEEDFAPYRAAAERVLALQCANHYGRRFPDEPLGQVAEIYLMGLLYPPTLIQEHLPAFGALKHLVVYFKELRISPMRVRELARNLSQFADERISLIGCMLYAAVHDGMPDPRTAAICSSKGTLAGMLRPVAANFRQQLGLHRDWLMNPEIDSGDIVRFRLECELSLHPWVYLPMHRVEDLRLHEVIFSLTDFDLPRAMRMLEALAKEDPKDIDVRLQLAYLRIACYHFEEAEAELRALLTEPKADKEPSVYELLGLIRVRADRLEDSVPFYEKANRFLTVESPRYVQIIHHYSSVLIATEDTRKALALIQILEQATPFVFPVLLNKLLALIGIKEYAEAGLVLRKLLALNAYDRQVFVHLFNLEIP